MPNVRVLVSPDGRFIAVIEVADRSHLQPAEEAVDVWCIGKVAPSAFKGLHLTEPSEEEEEIADADASILKVSLCGARLPKAGPPAGPPRSNSSIEIRIKVRARCHAARIALERRGKQTSLSWVPQCRRTQSQASQVLMT